MTEKTRKQKLMELELRSQRLLQRVRWPNGRRCSGTSDETCGSRRFRKIVRKRGGGLPIVTYQCRRCGQRFRATSNTIFDRSRFPLCLWFAALGAAFRNTQELAERLRIPYKRAWTLLTKIKYGGANKELLAKLRTHRNSISRISYEYCVLSRPAQADSRCEAQLRIRQLIQSGMSQRAIAKMLNCRQYAVHSWSRGNFRPIPIFEYRLRHIDPSKRKTGASP
jgi:hypothetical protein